MSDSTVTISVPGGPSVTTTTDQLKRAADATRAGTHTRFARDQLKAFVERIERLDEEKKAIADDIKDVYAEAKCNGYDVAALRAVIRLRRQDADERREHETILETYMHALGMI